MQKTITIDTDHEQLIVTLLKNTSVNLADPKAAAVTAAARSLLQRIAEAKPVNDEVCDA